MPPTKKIIHTYIHTYLYLYLYLYIYIHTPKRASIKNQPLTKTKTHLLLDNQTHFFFLSCILENNPMANSYAHKNFIKSDLPEEEEEESGWTAYLEDFSSSGGGGGRSFVSSSPSLMSDAAWNGMDSSLSEMRRLNFKRKTTNRKYYSCNDRDHDLELEDTASSPVNSPKVSDNNSSRPSEVNYSYRRLFHHDNDNDNHNIHHITAAGNFHQGNMSEVGADEKNEKTTSENKNNNNNNNNIDEYVNLRKRGLCLVPMATFINFLG
ncbi:vascular-related unknown protein 1-like [Andrographis paniculata]|uniref:vascular-related unknown protein 1-like n=1 Tax=Andrographis paniculata TaxID=175694 RepID=UPI0021E840E6|nr:vascular-related unknown protein 1-like [Andrographis paniculata]